MIKSPVPVVPERHAGKRWLPNRSMAFAAAEAAIPLVAAEMPKAALAMPVAFVMQGGEALPVALVGLETGRNLFVLPDGRWLGEYVPAMLRGYPFVLGRPSDGGEPMLCFDEGSGLIADEHSVAAVAGELFFAPEGGPSPALSGIIDFMRQVENSRVATARACAALMRHGLLVPWDLRVRNGAEEQAVTGLHRVDEAALNRLPDEAFLELRAAGALGVAYAHLLSQGKVGVLGQLAGLHARAAAQQAPAAAPAPGAAGDHDFEQLRGMTFEF